jgi:tRNA-guanine transglycosylase
MSALKFQVLGTDKRARASILTLPHAETLTPIFMPVGTGATIKGLSAATKLGGTSCTMLLGNTYHLSQRPGSHIVKENGGIHKFMNHSGNVLTDSGGFQMVSLFELSELDERGVTFESPADGTRMLLTPEASIRAQHDIGADVVMALDDVVSSVTEDNNRFREATERTLRWLDRCLDEHEKRKDTQALFAIVQGGLDVEIGGLRELCLEGFKTRDHRIPGYAIGGVAGGESKDSFWKVVEFCAKRLPADKPRYLMGVGDPLDLVVAVSFGVDMFDCVYPTRTARFGTALTKYGTVNLKHRNCQNDQAPVEVGCDCRACSTDPKTGRKFTRALFHQLFKVSEQSNVAGSALSHHNISYMLRLCKEMQEAIKVKAYDHFVREFLKCRYGLNANGSDWEDTVPDWVKDALKAAGVIWRSVT